MKIEQNLDKEPRATINPYRITGVLLLFRVLWALAPVFVGIKKEDQGLEK